MTESSVNNMVATKNNLDQQSLSEEFATRNLRTLVISSCTGEKRFQVKNQLVLEDFKDSETLKLRSSLLSEFACAAGQLYTGTQHLKAMEAVNILRSYRGKEFIDLKILSAGYGLISEDQVIVPYSVTFNSMKSQEIDAWADFLKIHESFQEAITGYDLVFVLLGEKYLRALKLPVETSCHQTFIFFASNQSVNYIEAGNAKSVVVPLSNAEAARFGCALVGLKGYLLKLIATEIKEKPNLLEILYNNPEILKQLLINQPHQLELSFISSFQNKEKLSYPNKTKKATESREENLQKFLELPVAANQHLPMQYFIPEWDDKVDGSYNFLQDKYSQGRNAYRDDIYAHEIYSEPNYHGILVSKVVVDKRKSKRADIENAGGIKNFIRFPGQVMGDCGAFGYIKQEEPPYNTVEILDYYENLKFDYGVSIDHLIVGPFAQPGMREKRYELTLKNAEEFLLKHQKQGYSFTPIGVAQGWNPQTYADAVKELIRIGYKYIAIGGAARTPTLEILEILKEVYQHLTPQTRLHLFGVGRIEAIPYFRHLGVTSFDSASPLRKAWFDAVENYHTLSGKIYAAVRIPFVDKPSQRIKYLLETGYKYEMLKSLEQNALSAIRAFDRGQLSLEETLEKLLAFDQLLELPRDGQVKAAAKARRFKLHSQMYRELLEAKPWQQCECEVCKQAGIETVIFRGNDRNRRRGFHNTYIFFKRFKKFLDSENLDT